MQADLCPHDPGLDDIADDGNDDVQHQQRQSPGKITAQRGENDPGDHDASGAQNGENIENGDQQSRQNRTVHTDDGQTDGQFHKGDGHDEGVGADADKQRPYHIRLDLEHHIPGVSPEAAQAEPHDLLVVDGNEECGDHHQQQPDQEAGQGGGEGGGHGHAAHHHDGETGDQLPQHIEQLGLQFLQRRHEGGVQLGQQLLQPTEKVGELRKDIGGIERGNLLYQRRDGGRDPDSRQRQQQADGAVCEDHQQYRHQPLGHVEHPGEKADGAAQHIGDQKRQDERQQQRQRILQ